MIFVCLDDVYIIFDKLLFCCILVHISGRYVEIYIYLLGYNDMIAWYDYHG
jgi:hypothetical protein